MYEAKVLVEAGGGTGSFDVSYFKMTDKAHPLPQPESSSSEQAKSSSSVKSSSSTEALPVELQMAVTGGTFQVFDMQGRFLGNLEVAPGATLTKALKVRFQNAGVYLVKGNGRLHRIAVK